MGNGKYPLLIGGLLIGAYGFLMLMNSFFMISSGEFSRLFCILMIMLPSVLLAAGILGVVFCSSSKGYFFAAQIIIVLILAANIICTAVSSDTLRPVYQTLASWSRIDISVFGDRAYWIAALFPFGLFLFYYLGVMLYETYDDEVALTVAKTINYALLAFVYVPLLFSVPWVHSLLASPPADFPQPVFIFFYVLYIPVFFLITMGSEMVIGVFFRFALAAVLLIPYFWLMWLISGLFVLLWTLVIYLGGLLINHWLITSIILIAFGGSAPYLLYKYVNNKLVSVEAHGNWSGRKSIDGADIGLILLVVGISATLLISAGKGILVKFAGEETAVTIHRSERSANYVKKGELIADKSAIAQIKTEYADFMADGRSYRAVFDAKYAYRNPENGRDIQLFMDYEIFYDIEKKLYKFIVKNPYRTAGEENKLDVYKIPSGTYYISDEKSGKPVLFESVTGEKKAIDVKKDSYAYTFLAALTPKNIIKMNLFETAETKLYEFRGACLFRRDFAYFPGRDMSGNCYTELKTFNGMPLFYVYRNENGGIQFDFTLNIYYEKITVEIQE